VLAAMRSVPRHLFVPVTERSQAYEDSPLPIGQGQTISQPYIVAYMLHALNLIGSEKVLEIGTGSGYQAALLGKLAKEVHTVERFPDLAEQAERVLSQFDYSNVHVHNADGSAGLPGYAPYDAIIVAAGAPIVPQPLLDQLGPNGRLLLPVGEQGHQVLQLWMRHGDEFDRDDLVPVAFVPLVGEYGWTK
jgi:protein-L-isoaspartate(D-aspartate) O-methyltransferase